MDQNIAGFSWEAQRRYRSGADAKVRGAPDMFNILYAIWGL